MKKIKILLTGLLSFIMIGCSSDTTFYKNIVESKYYPKKCTDKLISEGLFISNEGIMTTLILLEGCATKEMIKELNEKR